MHSPLAEGYGTVQANVAVDVNESNDECKASTRCNQRQAGDQSSRLVVAGVVVGKKASQMRKRAHHYPPY